MHARARAHAIAHARESRTPTRAHSHKHTLAHSLAHTFLFILRLDLDLSPILVVLRPTRAPLHAASLGAKSPLTPAVVTPRGVESSSPAGTSSKLFGIGWKSPAGPAPTPPHPVTTPV